MIRPGPGVTDGYSDAELEAMMACEESDLVERNASSDGDAGRSVREAVCAFANDLPEHRRSGVVFVGATDDGRPSGLAITDRLLLQLADIRTDGNIVPPPSLTVGKRLLFGEAVAVVTVEPSDAPPVRYRGRTWVRVGPRRAVATVQDERALNEKRRHRDPHFDDRIEINSPGGPYGAVTADNFGEPGALDYRNPIIAEAMRVLGLVQRFGFGIPAARRALKENGQQGPEFRVEPNWVRCTVRVGPGR